MQEGRHPHLGTFAGMFACGNRILFGDNLLLERTSHRSPPLCSLRAQTPRIQGQEHEAFLSYVHSKAAIRAASSILAPAAPISTLSRPMGRPPIQIARHASLIAKAGTLSSYVESRMTKIYS